MSLIDKLGLTSKKKKVEEVKPNRKQRRAEEKSNRRGQALIQKAIDRIGYQSKRDQRLQRIERKNEMNRQRSAIRREEKKQANIKKHNERMAQQKKP